MSLGQRFGNFLLVAGAVSLFIFYASLHSESKVYHFEALLIGVAALIIGWRMRFAKRPAPPPIGKGGSETRPDKAPPPAPAPAARKSGGLLSSLFKGRGGPPPKPAAPLPPKAPPPRKGLTGLFGAKPKPPAQGKPPQKQ
jgi:hypothetical protein